MSMSEWAKREIEIAIQREKDLAEKERKELEAKGEKCDQFGADYGIACYESALKAFESLCNDGHTGYSIGITKNILNRLIDGKCLVPIEDTPDVWRKCSYNDRKDYDTYQCKRMSSLFKDVYKDGHIEYHDNDRFVCENVDNPNCTYHSSFASGLLYEMFPIEMPYMPANKPYRVIVEDCLTDRKNGDFDTMCIFRVITPNEETVEVNRAFKKDGDGWKEIDADEWQNRVIMHKKRRENETQRGS